MVPGSGASSWLILVLIAPRSVQQPWQNLVCNLSSCKRALAVWSGLADAVIVETQIQLTREDAGNVVFRGQYAAVIALEALDISVLGRDIIGMFAVIVDRLHDVVCLLGQRNRYSIEQD
jgi:hypothetical protein